MKTTATLVTLALLGLVCAPAALPFEQPFIPDPPPFGQQPPPPRPAGPLLVPPETVFRGGRLDSMYVARETGGALFENVASVLTKKYYDSAFRKDVLPKLITQYAEKAKGATTLLKQREVVEDFLSNIPASHLGLLSLQTHRNMFADLEGRAYPMFGFQLIEDKGRFYAFFVLEGGPAQRAGLLSWDRIVSIDNVPVEQSARLDWRSDDAYIKDDRDPPVHGLTAAKGDAMKIKVERHKGKFLTLTVPAEDYSAFTAAKNSAHVYKTDGHGIGYVHIWYVHMTGVPEFLKREIEGEFANCEGFILDLRGRGGNGLAIQKILDVIRPENSGKHWPIVALIDRQSRSAKDILAYEFKKKGLARLVGEPTAGAVIPASFADVGYETVLMFPSFKLPGYTDLLEFKPVEPDVFVERGGPLSAGEDPILKAGISEVVKLLKAQTK